MKRHRDREVEERDDHEDEAPLVVDALDSLTSRERRKATGTKGGALFKGGVSDKFQASAHRAIQEAAAGGEGRDDEEPAAGGKILFKAGKGKKRAADSTAGGLKEAKGKPRAKASRNTKLLSFSQDDEEEG